MKNCPHCNSMLATNDTLDGFDYTCITCNEGFYRNEIAVTTPDKEFSCVIRIVLTGYKMKAMSQEKYIQEVHNKIDKQYGFPLANIEIIQIKEHNVSNEVTKQ